MNRPIALGIALTSLLAAGGAVAAPATDGAKAEAKPAAHGGGKCASGKCGTEKIYSATKIAHDPNGKLIAARDGKCGLSGKGYKVTASNEDRMAEGICGR